MSMILENYQYIAYDYADKRSFEFPFMSSPWPVICAVALYLWFVNVGGPKFMKNRPPYKLDKVIQIYNIFQIVISTYIFYKGVGDFVYGGTSITCGEVDQSQDPDIYYKFIPYYMYVVMKFVDFADTIFFILRKKTSQITLLHVFHHAVVATAFGIIFRYTIGGHVVFLGTINSFVHAVMYTYYLLTSYNKEYGKNLWWKKHLTQLQIVQFACIAVHSLGVFLPGCTYPWPVAMLWSVNNAIIAALFLNFYRKTYMTKKDR